MACHQCQQQFNTFLQEGTVFQLVSGRSLITHSGTLVNTLLNLCSSTF